MDASPSDSSTSMRNPCSTAGLAHQAARAWPPLVAAPTLYHHQWWRPRHRPSPQRRRSDNTNSGTLGAPAPAFDFSVPALEPSTAAGNGRPGLLSEHPLLALRKGPAAALGPGDGDGPPWLPNGRGAGGVKQRTEGMRRPPTGVAAPQDKGATAAPAGGIQGRRRPPRGGNGAPPEIRRRRFKGQERVPNRNPCPPFSWAKSGHF